MKLEIVIEKRFTPYKKSIILSYIHNIFTTELMKIQVVHARLNRKQNLSNQGFLA